MIRRSGVIWTFVCCALLVACNGGIPGTKQAAIPPSSSAAGPPHEIPGVGPAATKAPPATFTVVDLLTFGATSETVDIEVEGAEPASLQVDVDSPSDSVTLEVEDAGSHSYQVRVEVDLPSGTQVQEGSGTITINDGDTFALYYVSASEVRLEEE